MKYPSRFEKKNQPGEFFPSLFLNWRGKVRSPHLLYKLPDDQWEEIIGEAKSLLHASRDALRTNGKSDETLWNYNDGYYGEAFGMFRTLVSMNFAYISSTNTPAERENVKWLFSEITKEVIEEENFYGNRECDYCLNKYGRDDAGRRLHE